MSERPTVKMTLTPEQQAAIRQATGQQVATLRLKLEELEQRLAPLRGQN